MLPFQRKLSCREVKLHSRESLNANPCKQTICPQDTCPKHLKTQTLFNCMSCDSFLLSLSQQSFTVYSTSVFYFLKIFFWFGPFLKSLICYNIVSVLCFGFLATRHVRFQLPNWGLNLHPSHWKMKSQPLDFQGSCLSFIFSLLFLFPETILTKAT